MGPKGSLLVGKADSEVDVADLVDTIGDVLADQSTWNLPPEDVADMVCDSLEQAGALEIQDTTPAQHKAIEQDVAQQLARLIEGPIVAAVAKCLYAVRENEKQLRLSHSQKKKKAEYSDDTIDVDTGMLARLVSEAICGR